MLAGWHYQALCLLRNIYWLFHEKQFWMTLLSLLRDGTISTNSDFVVFLPKKKKKVIKQKAADLSIEKTGVLKFPIMWALFYVKETEMTIDCNVWSLFRFYIKNNSAAIWGIIRATWAIWIWTVL